ncbi:bestrophin-2-like isoform X6 [Schistocerca americana]|uniref:bestrophin-2-like isoform X6 n=1 Tax=Schistocerca americana TaxID=7009 RepID=UPI001F4F6678|nr:bestrophin-2-like isoform X6 [Schistocerca americana]XP_046985392.1 bestrophin-2-like isoform X6 [Schistocerca americana]XP_049782406.1 bestrophin-2-like isoform X4 [Schistocerca cancellata]XP_049953214.1 bestrophin-2-like isoform X4 [Schistocerca serialis cubense]XP_049953215.1 bestrophin-2-like isoform X4 [Schistocerca serialis cubense]
MTVSYQYEVASSTSGGFTRLLFMWRGSLYKLIYRELLLFVVSFGLLSALYRNAFTKDQRTVFEKMVIYCDTFINLIPLSFVLGFYVAYVAGRWWQQYMAIPWPDKIMHSIALYVNGNDEQGRMVRRTLMRYLNLTLILVLRSISSAVKRRFPTLEHVVESGFMTPVELEMYQSVPSVEFNTYWIPCTWFISLLKETRRTGRINDAQGLKIIMEEFNDFRSKCGLLWSYDWVSIPLVYTQVVTIATYSFFLAALVGRQYVGDAKKPLQMEIDIYIPVFTILQFFFFMGLLKVAEQLINPFGDDDEDFELNWLIDRHTKVSYLGVDTLMAKSPPLVKDMYFDQVDLILPYTEASVAYKKKTYRGSVHNMQVPEEKHMMFLPEIIEEDEDRASITRASLQNLHTSSSASGLNTPTTSPAAGCLARLRKGILNCLKMLLNMRVTTHLVNIWRLISQHSKTSQTVHQKELHRQ